MGKISEFLEDKGAGFYCSVVTVLVSIVLIIAYPACYAGTTSINWWAFVLILISIAANAALFFLKKENWMPVVSAVLSGLALCFFIYGIYWYVSIVMVGIDLSSFDAAFILNAILFILVFGLSIANNFLKQTRSNV